ncbi:hypothetical protein IWQ60_010936 [Tieghemiomyces parasiticus]|uniref:Armadillo repeat-containing protein 8 n=1 Tax=Tieghemiomyces parasiticus TaxID=78921 RepID=A0A9W7ZKG9_9FUNG|nr:hypothetical protein IWQ60_010936 [Tieghemiomyces parasiticus]
MERHRQAACTLDDSTDLAALYTTTRFIKNNIIGNVTKKRLYIELGVIPRLAAIIRQQLLPAVDGTATPPTAAQEDLVIQALTVVASLAQGTAEGLSAVLAEALPRTLGCCVRPDRFSVALVGAILHALKVVLTNVCAARRHSPVPPLHLLSPPVAATKSVLHHTGGDLPDVSSPAPSNPQLTPHAIATAPATLPSPSNSYRCPSPDPMEADLPRPLADPVGFDRPTLSLLIDLLDPAADTWAQGGPFSARMAVAETCAATLARVCELEDGAMFPSVHDSDDDDSLETAFPLALRARAVQLLLRLLTAPQLGVQSAALDALAALVRERPAVARILLHVDPVPLNQAPAAPLTTAELVRYAKADDEATTVPTAAADRIADFTVSTTTDPTVQLLAATCLAFLHRAAPGPALAPVARKRVAPLLVRLLGGFRFRRSSEGVVGVLWDAAGARHPEQPGGPDGSVDIGSSATPAFVGYGDRPPLGSPAPAPPLFLQLPVVLAYLVADSETLQDTCCERGALTLLTDLLGRVNPSPDVTPAAPADPAVPTDDSPALLSEVDRFREGVLVAIAALCALHEPGREKLSARGLPAIVRALAHAHPQVRLAACQCLRSLSRSPKLLRTHLMDAHVGEALYELTADSHLAVRLGAMDALCNVVLDFTSLRQLIMDRGGIERFARLTDGPNWDVQVRAVWFLKNALFNASRATAARIMAVLTYDRLGRLAASGHVDLERHTLGLMRNLIMTSPFAADELLVGLELDRFGRLLAATLDLTYPALVEEALYVLANLAAAAPRHRYWIIRQPSLMRGIADALLHTSHHVVVPAVWCITNLFLGEETGDNDPHNRHQSPTNPDAEVGGTNATAADRGSSGPGRGPLDHVRVVFPDELVDQLRQLEVEARLRALADFPHLDVRNRSRAALTYFSEARSSLAASTGRATSGGHHFTA